LRRITLEVFDFNPRGRRVYEKVGYAVTGTRPGALVFDGVAVGAVDMAVDAQRWAGFPAPADGAAEGGADAPAGGTAGG
jgi:RimJ/RimL family protein N-acetyltransferase